MAVGQDVAVPAAGGPLRRQLPAARRAVPLALAGEAGVGEVPAEALRERGGGLAAGAQGGRALRPPPPSLHTRARAWLATSRLRFRLRVCAQGTPLSWTDGDFGDGTDTEGGLDASSGADRPTRASLPQRRFGAVKTDYLRGASNEPVASMPVIKPSLQPLQPAVAPTVASSPPLAGPTQWPVRWRARRGVRWGGGGGAAFLSSPAGQEFG